MSPKGEYRAFAESILVICKYLKILIILSFTLPQRKVSRSEHLVHSDDSLHALNTVVTQGGKVEGSCKKQACLLSCFSRPHGLYPVAPLSMGLFRQEYWSGLPLPSPKVIVKQVEFICTIAKQIEAVHMPYKKDEKKGHNNFANTYWQK